MLSPVSSNSRVLEFVDYLKSLEKNFFLSFLVFQNGVLSLDFSSPTLSFLENTFICSFIQVLNLTEM